MISKRVLKCENMLNEELATCYWECFKNTTCIQHCDEIHSNNLMNCPCGSNCPGPDFSDCISPPLSEQCDDTSLDITKVLPYS